MMHWTPYGPCWSPSLLGDVILAPTNLPTPFCPVLSSDGGMCSKYNATYQCFQGPSFTENVILPWVLGVFSVKSLLCLPSLRLTGIFLYLVDCSGTEWTSKEITVREVEQQQCTDYRQDLCEEHMISALIPLSDWPWWRGGGGWDRSGAGLDSLGHHEIRTESDDSGSWFNRKSSRSQSTS